MSNDFEKDDDKNYFIKMFIAKQCNGCSTAPLTQYKNNEIYQEIMAEDEYTNNDTDDRIWINMRRSKGYTDELEKINHDDSGLAVILGFSEATTKKLRLRITEFLRVNIGIYCQTTGISCHSKTTIFLNQIKLKKPKCLQMGRKKYVKKRKRNRKRNGIYFGKKPQTVTGVVSKVIARLLENIGSANGI